MNDKLEQIKNQLEEILQMDIDQQPAAFAALHEQLEKDLNSDKGNSAE
ncbi:MAG: hypothetical protein RIQ88_124 [Actinomycetota bacterium]